MSKSLLFILSVMIVCSVADPIQDIKSIVERDQCGMNGFATLRPEMENQIALLKQDQNNMEAKAKLIALIEDAKDVYEGCNLKGKVDPVLGDAVKAAGMAFLLASNCFKDVGIVLLIVDSIVEDPKDITNDIIVLIFVAILGRQGYADCEQFIHFIL